jgi:transposase
MNSNRKEEHPTPMQPIDYIGIDVSKLRLDYTTDGTDSHHVPNTEAGHRRLVEHLKKGGRRVRVICEPTAGYEQSLLLALSHAAIEVSLVHPTRVRAFATAEGLHAKTDAIDAKLLRRFAQRMAPELVTPIDPARCELRQLLDFRRCLVDDITAHSNRLETAKPTLQKLLKENIRSLERSLAKVEEAIAELIKSTPELKASYERLCQMQGVGPIVASSLLAYVPELGKAPDARISSLVGVAPHPDQSGGHDGKRAIHAGRITARNALYMAAVSASRCNPVLAPYYQRLIANGKAPKVALVAVMRRLLCTLNKMLAQPNFVLAQ